MLLSDIFGRAIRFLPFLAGALFYVMLKTLYYPHGGLELRFMNSMIFGMIIGMGISYASAVVLRMRGASPRLRLLLPWAFLVVGCFVGELLTVGITRGGRYFFAWYTPMWLFYPALCFFLVLAEDCLDGGRRMFMLTLLSVAYYPLLVICCVVLLVWSVQDLFVFDIYCHVVVPFVYLVVVPAFAAGLVRRFPRLGSRAVRFWRVFVALPAFLMLYPVASGLVTSLTQYPDNHWGTFGSASDTAFISLRNTRNWDDMPFTMRLLMVLESGGNVARAQELYLPRSTRVAPE